VLDFVANPVPETLMPFRRKARASAGLRQGFGAHERP